MTTIKLREPTQEGKDKIEKAAKSDNVQTLEELASHGVDITGIINEQGSTAFHWAAQQGSDNVIAFLRHKANVNAVNKMKWTPLHFAASYNRSDTVVLLVNSGADINMKNVEGMTPLEVAVSAGCSYIVHYFVKTKGMDITEIHEGLQEYAIELLNKAEKEKEEKHKNFMEKIIINNKKEKLRLYKIVIFGPSRAGKSSLFQVLLGKTPKDDAESTGVYQYQMFKVAVTMAGSNFAPKWHEIELQDEIVRLGSILDKKRNEQPDLPDNDAMQQSKPIPLEVENIIYKMSADQAVKEFMITSTLMVCYDSGGQSEFFDVMPLLATNPTGYIMVLDMRNDLNEKVHSKAKRHGKECSLETNTTKNLMKNALASVQSCSSHLSCENLLVVGTHLDKCVNEAGRIDEQTITKLDNDLHNELVKGTAESLFRECQNYKHLKLKHVHPVANKIGSNIEIKEVSDHSLQEIRVAVESMSKNNELQEEISIKWLLFLYQLQLKVEKFPHYISKMECNEYIEHCQIDKCDVDKLLEYFHKLGFIFYFKKYVKDVVFSPQWVFERLSDIIFEKYKPEGDDVYIENGEITKKKFRNIFQKEVDKEGKIHKLDDQSIEYLLKIFCGQNIMTEFKNEVYFMPALLSPGSSDDPSLQESIKSLCGNRIYERLYVSFKDHYFPRAMFCYLATELTRHEWEIQPSPRYSNILVFQIPHSNQYVGLFDDKTELVVEVYKKRDEDLTKKPHEITELLFNFINECCRQIEIQQSFEFGFTCRKINDCKLFAGVKLQYPVVPEKHCKKCKTASLTSDELVWLISPKIINIMGSDKHQHQQAVEQPAQVPRDTFDCVDAAKTLRQKTTELMNLPYRSMQDSHYGKGIIMGKEKERLDKMTSSKQMSELIDILINSLNLNFTKKYKWFLQSLEESEDVLLPDMAEKLGGSKLVPEK